MTYYPISNSDKVNRTSNIRQLVDILQVDIANKDSAGELQNTRKNYEVFVTSSIELPGVVTSSLFHTVFDQDYSLQTSNEILDMSIGLNETGETVTGNSQEVDSSGKLIFGNDTLMMREKINIYKQYAQVLLGDASSSFYSPFDSSDAVNRIDEALFINIKRLFSRDGLEKEQISFKIYKAPSAISPNIDVVYGADVGDVDENNFVLYSDTDTTLHVTPTGGEIGEVTDGTNKVGLIFYNRGIIVLDASKVFNSNDVISGPISAVTGDTAEPVSFEVDENNVGTLNFNGNFIPNFWVSGSIDNILDHIAGTRFGRGTNTAIGLINKTSINSTIYFCRVGPNEANFSTNPTYIKSDGTIRCIQDRGDDPFAYVTTIGLYGGGELLAVAKTSRPIEKNPEVDLSISVRLDY